MNIFHVIKCGSCGGESMAVNQDAAPPVLLAVSSRPPKRDFCNYCFAARAEAIPPMRERYRATLRAATEFNLEHHLLAG